MICSSKTIFLFRKIFVIAEIKGKFTPMTNSQLVQYLADGYTVSEIADEEKVSRRTLEKRILNLRNECLCKTVAQLVANYLRRKLIK